MKSFSLATIAVMRDGAPYERIRDVDATFRKESMTIMTDARYELELRVAMTTGFHYRLTRCAGDAVTPYELC
jgi:hypothetical protein